MAVDTPPRPAQPRLTEFFPAVPGRDPRWNRTQLRSKLPVEIVKKIVDFALGPPCRCETGDYYRIAAHHRTCACFSCLCTCYQTTTTASKLERVSFVFRQLTEGRSWCYKDIEGYQLERLGKLLAYLGDHRGREPATLARVRRCDVNTQYGAEDDPASGIRLLAEALERMKGLHALQISTYGVPWDATKSVVAASTCADLRSLRLRGISLSGASLSACLRAARHLKTLELGGPCTVDEGVMEALAGSVAPTLECLTVNRGSYTNDDTASETRTALRDRHLLRIVETVRSLMLLDLDDCAELTDDSLGAAFEKFRELAFVRLRSCPRVTDSSLARLGSSCLRELVLDSSEDVGDVSIVPILHRNSGIEWLSLKKTRVTDAIVPHLLASRLTINDLSLSYTLVTWTGLQPLIESEPPQLYYLGISSVAGVDDASVRCIREHLPGLQTLKLAGCAGITRPETLLYTVFKRQGTLDNLSLSGIPIADADLIAALERIAGDELYFSDDD
ncbi:hypothetical protein DFJ74DRAFT_712042 [Hyaloraphidium curvatum]|nr:hypothetical protein DFJ74DRAFT_712042 [Hyaloraphidium curvatum]